MNTHISASFTPDFSFPPGHTLIEVLANLGLSQADLAERTGRPKKTINEIVRGKAAITPETAIQFERVLGTSASFWISLEQNYRSCLARQHERAELEKHVAWLDKFPISELLHRKWIEPANDRVDQLRAVLTFFGVASPDAWSDVWEEHYKSTVFRRSTNAQTSKNIGAIAAWLRRGELVGRKVDCKSYSASKFREALQRARSRTSSEINAACVALKKECAEAGVVVVLVPEFPSTGICGATRWLTADKALLQLSLLYKRDDQFWFSFFHEAGHILLHSKREIFVDRAKTEDEATEREANEFARDLLIPMNSYQQFVAKQDFGRLAIATFASAIGISVSIVVGRLQHDRHLTFSELNDLHTSLKWA